MIIKAACGRAVLLDSEDAARLPGKVSIGSHGYAQIWDGTTVVLLHRWLLGLAVGDPRKGDHENGMPLDNQRSNLRISTASGNSQNVSGRGRSKYLGVVRAHSKVEHWQARVKWQGRMHYFGTYETELQAAIVAARWRREHMPYYVDRGAQVDTITVADFLVDPDLLGRFEPLDDDELLALGEIAPQAHPDMPLNDLLLYVRMAAYNDMGCC
jgi:hypothetical protein